MPTVEESLEENVTGPKRVSGDEATVEQHDPEKQIAVDRYLASKEAAKKGLGFRRTRVSPPGAV